MCHFSAECFILYDALDLFYLSWTSIYLACMRAHTNPPYFGLLNFFPLLFGNERLALNMERRSFFSMLSGNFPILWFLLLPYPIACIFFLFFSVSFFTFFLFKFCFILFLAALLYPYCSATNPSATHLSMSASIESHFCWGFERSDFWDEFAKIFLWYQGCFCFAPLFCMLCFPAEQLLSSEYNYELRSSSETLW